MDSAAKFRSSLMVSRVASRFVQARGAYTPDTEEQSEADFQAWCKGLVLYSLRDDHDFTVKNQTMHKSKGRFEVEVSLGDKKATLAFTHKDSQIKVEAKGVGSWTFDADEDYSKAGKKIAQAFEG